METNKTDRKILLYLGFGIGIGFSIYMATVFQLFVGEFTTEQGFVGVILGIIILTICGYYIEKELEE